MKNPTIQRLPADSQTIRKNIIDSEFNCDDREPGFYADVENECQVWCEHWVFNIIFQLIKHTLHFYHWIYFKRFSIDAYKDVAMFILSYVRKRHALINAYLYAYGRMIIALTALNPSIIIENLIEHSLVI